MVALVRSFTAKPWGDLLIRTSIATLGIAAWVILFGSLWSQADDYYNELFTADGQARPQYAEVLKIYNRMKPKEKKAFLADTMNVDFKGDNMLDPIPRILTQSEYGELQRGVEQRGTALRMFLQEYYAGGKSWEKVIPAPVLEAIISRAGESGFAGKMNPAQVAFPYGPDIIRTARGQWAVLEDNPGYIGGIGDLKQAHESMFKRMPGYKSAMPLLHDPMEYYQAVVERAKKRSIPPGSSVVLYMVPPYPDNEDRRIRKIFTDLGVEVVTPNSKTKLMTTPDGMFVDKAGKRERVGYVFLNAEHKWVDLTDPATRDTWLLFKAQELVDDFKGSATMESLRLALQPEKGTGKVNLESVRAAYFGWESKLAQVERQSVPGFMKAIYEGKVATNYAPGLDFVGDKEFYTFVDDLICHYLKEEPVFNNLRTRRFSTWSATKGVQLDEKLLKEIFEEGGWKSNVIKIVDGRGGDGIYIGPKMKESELPALIEKIKARPEGYIVQEYQHPSVIEDRIGDLRLISDVGPDSIYVSRTPWGRGVPLTGNGKVNLSDKGREFMVGVVPDPSVPRVPGCVGATAAQYLKEAP